MSAKPGFLGRMIPLLLAASALLTAWPALSQNPPAQAPTVPPDLRILLAPKQSEMLNVVERYGADREQLNRFYYLPSPLRFSRLKRFDLDWAEALNKLEAAKLSTAAKDDLQRLKAAVAENLAKTDSDAAAAARLAPIIPFAADIQGLEEARLRMETMDAKTSALILSGVVERIKATRTALAAAPGSVTKAAAEQAAAAVGTLGQALRNWQSFYAGYNPFFTWWMAQPYKETDDALAEYATVLREKVAPSAPDESASSSSIPAAVKPPPSSPVDEVPDLGRLLRLPQDELRDIARLLNPERGAWPRGGADRGRLAAAAAPGPSLEFWKNGLAALKKLDFARLSRPAQITYLSLRHTLEGRIRRLEHPPAAGPQAKPDASGIIGRPLGREGLRFDLVDEMVPYTPEEVIEIGTREYAWCEAEMIKASEAMGFGQDWKKAMDKVKDMHVPPGGQPDAIRDLLREAVAYVRAKDLIAVPEIENETMRMEMISPERQLVNPFFTGGALISIAYPTDTMTTRQKVESMRGNNLPFSRAAAFHEMIPGHNLQSYVSQRYATYRSSIASSSFWSEGWAVYWEMLMYDLGFHDTPEKRIGALFWRMHRCARIVFSLKYHLGEWSPQECIDYLVDKVNFERENAVGEVRRSFAGGYGPLYQAAYQIGAMQLRQIRREIVDSGRLTLKDFHDAVMMMGSMPFPLLRLALSGQKLSPEMPLAWEFYGKISLK